MASPAAAYRHAYSQRVQAKDHARQTMNKLECFIEIYKSEMPHVTTEVWVYPLGEDDYDRSFDAKVREFLMSEGWKSEQIQVTQLSIRLAMTSYFASSAYSIKYDSHDNERG